MKKARGVNNLQELFDLFPHKSEKEKNPSIVPPFHEININHQRHVNIALNQYFFI